MRLLQSLHEIAWLNISIHAWRQLQSTNWLFSLQTSFFFSDKSQLLLHIHMDLHGGMHFFNTGHYNNELILVATKTHALIFAFGKQLRDKILWIIENISNYSPLIHQKLFPQFYSNIIKKIKFYWNIGFCWS